MKNKSVLGSVEKGEFIGDAKGWATAAGHMCSLEVVKPV